MFQILLKKSFMQKKVQNDTCFEDFRCKTWKKHPIFLDFALDKVHTKRLTSNIFRPIMDSGVEMLRFAFSRGHRMGKRRKVGKRSSKSKKKGWGNENE